jgi:hypothetical protein
MTPCSLVGGYQPSGWTYFKPTGFNISNKSEIWFKFCVINYSMSNVKQYICCRQCNYIQGLCEVGRVVMNCGTSCSSCPLDSARDAKKKWNTVSSTALLIHPPIHPPALLLVRSHNNATRRGGEEIKCHDVSPWAREPAALLPSVPVFKLLEWNSHVQCDWLVTPKLWGGNIFWHSWQ